MNIPIELFSLFIGTSIALAIFGFLRNPQIPAMLVFAGIFILSIVVSTDRIIMDYFSDSNGISSTNFYYVPSRTGQDDVRTGYGEIQAQYVSSSSSVLIGDIVNCATWHIKKSGSPDSDTIVRYGVWDNSATPMLKYTFGTMNVTNVGTVVTPVKMCNTVSPYTIVNSDRIGIAWNDGNATSRITVDVDTSNPYDSTITYNTRFNGASWIANTGTDMQGILSFEVNGDSVNTIEEIFEFTEFPKTIFALLAVIFMLTGGLMVFTREER